MHVDRGCLLTFSSPCISSFSLCVFVSLLTAATLFLSLRFLSLLLLSSCSSGCWSHKPATTEWEPLPLCLCLSLSPPLSASSASLYIPDALPANNISKEYQSGIEILYCSYSMPLSQLAILTVCFYLPSTNEKQVQVCDYEYKYSKLKPYLLIITKILYIRITLRLLTEKTHQILLFVLLCFSSWQTAAGCGDKNSQNLPVYSLMKHYQSLSTGAYVTPDHGRLQPWFNLSPDRFWEINWLCDLFVRKLIGLA